MNASDRWIGAAIALPFGLFAACGGRSIETVISHDGGGPPARGGGGASGSGAGAGTGGTSRGGAGTGGTSQGGAGAEAGTQGAGTGGTSQGGAGAEAGTQGAGGEPSPGVCTWPLGGPSQSGTPSSGAACGAAFGTSNNDFGYAIALDANGNLHVAASTFGSLGGTNAGGRDGCARKYDAMGTHQWTEQFGTSADDMADGVAVDASGNVYVGGYTDGSLGDASAGGIDGYVRKYDAAGTHQWTKQFGTSVADYAFGVAVDASESVYVAGYTGGALGSTDEGSNDGFVRKYDSGGGHLWTAQFGTSDIDQGDAVAVDTRANVYVVGHTHGSLGGTNAGNYDGFVRKYDSGGEHQWTAQFGTSNNDQGDAVAVDADGNVYVVGLTQGSLASTNAGYDDGFLRKYDSGGVHQWTAQFGTSNNERAYAVAVDRSGDVYVAGSTQGSLAGTSAGDSDGYVRKYRSDGTHQWTEQFGTPAADAFHGIAVDANGNVYVAGSTRGSLVGTAAGAYDGFVMQIPSR